MIRGASLLKETEGNSDVDELRAELIKQKIIFEAELRRQREVSNERFEAMNRQLHHVLEDNTQLRNTLHALGERLQLLEARGRSQSPMMINQPIAAVVAGSSNNNNNNISAAAAGGGGGGAVVVGPLANRVQQQRAGSNNSRQGSPLPRGYTAAQQQQQQQQQQPHFHKIRSSPSTTPRSTPGVTPRGTFTRTMSGGVSSTLSGGTSVTSPAHVNFRPVLKSHPPGVPFRSPMRQKELQQIGKQKNSSMWR